ncbi:Uncharacterised protein [Vibrio cholerae]|nr:Uncharacterised protein [Vibrio cholerae]CSI78576.1 Uncharacterised protein [Vibrio cholerae]
MQDLLALLLAFLWKTVGEVNPSAADYAAIFLDDEWHQRFRQSITQAPRNKG